MFAWPLTVDHIIPPAKWGTLRGDLPPSDIHALGNLATACHPCNRAKSDATEALDLITQQHVCLFNPRTDTWSEHFTWAEEHTLMLGVTPNGRATVRQLRPNRPVYRRQRQLLRTAMRAGGARWP